LKAALSRLEAEQKRRSDFNKLGSFQPYARQIEFYEAGASFRERLLMAANQVGKTYCGSREVAYHLTGRYPDWWTGHRFDRPIEVWAGSDTSETTRDTVQANLIGPPPAREMWGTAAIPGDAILDTNSRMGVADALDTVLVRHVSGGTSTLGFKSYDQRRQKWQGTKKDLIWLDEEPPMDIYMEALTRTNAVDDGRMMMTFTPLLGMSDVVHMFLDGEGRSITRMTIDDAEHISEEKRAQIIASYPEHEREARTKGIPALGSGRVYPVAESRISVPSFAIPRHWPCVAGIDFGWDHPTAAVKLAWDRDADVVYLTHAYRRREATPLEHVVTLREWGKQPWAWPQDGYQRDKRSGGTLREDYARLGLRMAMSHATFADGGNGVEAGVMALLQRMQTGRFKVFEHLEDWWSEFRLYHRKDGLIVKERDDLMDATRYALMMLRVAEGTDISEDDWREEAQEYGRSSATGY
jgi:phage terminase large subunit-like protein